MRDRAQKSHAWIYVAVIGAVLSIGLFFLGRYSAGPAQRTAVDTSAKSIAVLPFENLSDDKQNTYFADGVQDQILTNLARVSDLRVISHTTVRQYKSGEPRNLREIGRQLGVTHILEGSVQRAGDRLRIAAQLIDARTDSQIWAETYDRTAADLFAIQSELAESIVAQLQTKLSPATKGRDRAASNSGFGRVRALPSREANRRQLYSSLTTSELRYFPLCNRWIRQSNAIPILSPRTAISRARTIYSTFSISIQHQIESFLRKQQ